MHTFARLDARSSDSERVVIVVPAPDGVPNLLVLLTADLAGVDEICGVGGAQALAVLAYGTETIASVSKIVGPATALSRSLQRRVFDLGGIDMMADCPRW